MPSGKHYIDLARKSKNYAGERQSGSHVIIESKVSDDFGNSIAIPYHGNKDLPKGTEHAIVRRMKLLGLLTMLIVIGLAVARLCV